MSKGVYLLTINFRCDCSQTIIKARIPPTTETKQWGCMMSIIRYLRKLAISVLSTNRSTSKVHLPNVPRKKSTNTFHLREFRWRNWRLKWKFQLVKRSFRMINCLGPCLWQNTIYHYWGKIYLEPLYGKGWGLILGLNYTKSSNLFVRS